MKSSFYERERRNFDRIELWRSPRRKDENSKRGRCSHADSEVLRNLAEAQYSLTEALAREPVARFDESYRKRHRLGGLSTLHSAVRGLLRRGVIDVIKGTYVMADPFFARFVRERGGEK